MGHRSIGLLQARFFRMHPYSNAFKNAFKMHFESIAFNRMYLKCICKVLPGFGHAYCMYFTFHGLPVKWQTCL